MPFEGHTEDTRICRRPDGSIDIDHYDRLARRLRADDLRGGLTRLQAPIARLLRAAGSQPSARIRAFFGS